MLTIHPDSSDKSFKHIYFRLTVLLHPPDQIEAAGFLGEDANLSLPIGVKNCNFA